jgi:hypothetical protein
MIVPSASFVASVDYTKVNRGYARVVGFEKAGRQDLDEFGMQPNIEIFSMIFS